MRKLVRPSLITILVVLSVLYLVGCSGGKAESPSEVVKEVLKKANNGEYKKTEKYFTGEGLDGITYVDSTELAWVAITKNRTIDQINIPKEEIDGNEATIKYELTYEGGETSSDTCELIKVEEEWKINVF